MAGFVGIKDVAAAAGVSVGTVSNVMNKPQLVSSSTRDRVNAVIAELGFVRNESARQLRAGSSRAVGLVVIDASNPFFNDVARGVETKVYELDGAVLLGNSAGDRRRERRYLELFEELRVLGVLIAPTAEVFPSLTALTKLEIPVVFLDRFPDGEPYSSVSVDDLAGGRMAAAHLRERGHHRIAFVGGPSTLRQVRDRRQGAEAETQISSGDSLLGISTPGLTIAAGREAAEEILLLPAEHRPTGIFAANDLIALGLLQTFTTHGVRIPQDLAIIGYDDIEFAASAAVPLSSIRQPREELGRTGAAILFEEIAARRKGERLEPRAVQFQPELVVRRSSA